MKFKNPTQLFDDFIQKSKTSNVGVPLDQYREHCMFFVSNTSIQTMRQKKANSFFTFKKLLATYINEQFPKKKLVINRIDNKFYGFIDPPSPKSESDLGLVFN